MELDISFDWSSSDTEDEEEDLPDVEVDNNKTYCSWARPHASWSKCGEDIDFVVLDTDFRKESVKRSKNTEWYFRLFGVTESGNSCCCNVFNFLPYFYILHSDYAFSHDKDIRKLHSYLSQEVRKKLVMSKSSNVRKRIFKRDPIVSVCKTDASKTDQNISSGFVDKVKIESDFESKGYQLTKITCLCPRVVRAARKVLSYDVFQSEIFKAFGIRCEFYVIDGRYLICQWLRDLKISGCPWIKISDGKYLQCAVSQKSSHAQIELDVSFEMLQLLSCKKPLPVLRILSFDIEVLVTPPVFEFPLVASKPVLQIGNVIANLDTTKEFEPIRVIFTLKSCDPIPGAEVYSYEKEVDMLNAWSKFVWLSDPDILTGYNIHQFDLPYLFSRAERIGASRLRFHGRVKNVKAIQPMLTKNISVTSNYSNNRVAVTGKIVLDMMLIVMKHNMISHSKSNVHSDHDFSLGAVANRYLQNAKFDIKHTEIWELQAEGSETRKKLAMYCLHDALLPYLLLLRLELPDKYSNSENILLHYISNSSRNNTPLKYLLPMSWDSSWYITQSYAKTNNVSLERKNSNINSTPYHAIIRKDMNDLTSTLSVLWKDLETAELAVSVLGNSINLVSAENLQLELRVQDLITALNLKKPKQINFTADDDPCKIYGITHQSNKTNSHVGLSSLKTDTAEKFEKLTVHQMNGVKFLLNKVMSENLDGTGAILGCAVGSGKSAIVLKFWQEITAPNFAMLLLCTKNGVQNWKSEFTKWLTPEEQNKLFEINTRTNRYDFSKIAQQWSQSGGILLSTYKIQINEIFINPGPAVVILDEGHVIRNTCTNIHEAINMITTKRKIIVSGTVVQNSLEDIFSLSSVVKPGCLNSRKIFNHRWENAFEIGLVSPFLSNYTYNRAEKLREGIASIFYNSTSGTHLPVQSDWILHLRPSLVQKSLLNSLLKEIYSGNGFQEKHSHSVFEIESLISRILSHPDILLWNNNKSEKQLLPTWAADALKGYSPGKLNNGVKLEVLFEIFKDAADLSSKVVVYSKYLETLDMIEYYLSQHNDKRHKLVRVDGSTSSKKRQNIYNQINKKGGPSILLISTGSGSDAVNLHGASITVLMDVNWNPGVDTQCQGRTRRYAHENNSVVYRLVVEGTFDSLKLQHQSSKHNMVGLVMGVVGTGRDDAKKNSFDFLQLEHKIERSSDFCNLNKLPDQILRIRQNLMTSFANQVATAYYDYVESE